METLGYKRPDEIQDKIDYIVNNEHGKFFGIKKVTRDLYAIYNKATGKIVSEKSYPKGKALKILKTFE